MSLGLLCREARHQYEILVTAGLISRMTSSKEAPRIVFPSTPVLSIAVPLDGGLLSALLKLVVALGMWARQLSEVQLLLWSEFQTGLGRRGGGGLCGRPCAGPQPRVAPASQGAPLTEKAGGSDLISALAKPFVLNTQRVSGALRPLRRGSAKW